MRIRLNTDTIGRPARYSDASSLDYHMVAYDYVPFDTLMSPDMVYQTKSGSCHDFSMFELDELRREGYEPYAKFLIAMDSNGQGGETHSFVYFHTSRSAMTYWFEQAWVDFAGIHPFNSDEDLFACVIEEFKQRNPNQTIYMGDFIPSEHQVGEDLQAFVDICMNNAVEV